MYILRVKTRTNIRISTFLFKAGKDLATRRGMDFSELLSDLLRHELNELNVEWEVAPSAEERQAALHALGHANAPPKKKTTPRGGNARPTPPLPPEQHAS